MMHLTRTERRLAMVRKLPKPLPKNERQKLGIRNVEKGGCISFGGNVYLVEEKGRYQEKSCSWHELKLISVPDENIVFLEWEQDDELKVIAWAVGKYKFADLGFPEKALDRFDDEESGEFIFQDVVYVYDESDEAKWFKEGEKSGLKHYYWQFRQKGGEGFICVEKWDSGYEISTGISVDPRRIEILQVKS